MAAPTERLTGPQGQRGSHTAPWQDDHDIGHALEQHYECICAAFLIMNGAAFGGQMGTRRSHYAI
jgi:hypothetical protein